MKSTQQLVAFIGLTIITSLSAMPPMWPNCNCLTQDIKQYSTMFKNLQGSNRLTEFNHLTTILDAAATNGYTKDDMIQILGTPNNATTTQLQYWLQDAANKEVVTININETTKRVTGYAVSGLMGNGNWE